MSKLVDELKSEHKTLSSILKQVKELGSASEKAKDLLLQAKTALLKHLEKEDRELYPTLRKAAATDENINRKLKSFAEDMEEISAFVLKFFENVEQNTYNQLEYSRDFDRLVSVLSSRIRREETILYFLFDDLG